jgi:hypothetical protein
MFLLAHICCRVVCLRESHNSTVTRGQICATGIHSLSPLNDLTRFLLIIVSTLFTQKRLSHSVADAPTAPAQTTRVDNDGEHSPKADPAALPTTDRAEPSGRLLGTSWYCSHISWGGCQAGPHHPDRSTSLLAGDASSDRILTERNGPVWVLPTDHRGDHRLNRRFIPDAIVTSVGADPVVGVAAKIDGGPPIETARQR